MLRSADAHVELVGEHRAHAAGAAAAGAGFQLAALAQQHLDARLGEVEGDARSDHTAAHDHHVCPLHAPGYARDMSVTDTTTPVVSSIVAGRAQEQGTRIESRNPAKLDELVCEALLGDADTFVDACRAARAAQRAWAHDPGARARQRDQAHRPAGRGQQGGAGAAADARDRQALPGVARRGAGDRRHLRLLRLRGPAPVRADGPERAAGQAAVHLPQPRRRGRDRHGRQLPGRGAVLVHRAGAAVRQRRGLEARRVRAGAGGGAGAAVHPRRASGRRAEPRPVRRPVAPSPASSGRSTSGWSTRSASPARRPSARRSASSADATCSRPASSSAARTRSW